MEKKRNDQIPDGKNIHNTYIKFVFENFEEVQAKLHRLVELEKEARTLMLELSSEKLILGAEFEWKGTSKEEYSCPFKQVNEQTGGYDIDKVAEDFSQTIQRFIQE